MLTKFRKLVLIEQTLFGLPWALIGALFACLEVGFHNVWREGIFIVLAFTCARTAGMSFNRLIDKDIDAKNPRTQNRPLQTGEVTERQVAVIAWVALVGFLVICFCINKLCFLLAWIPAILIVVYSFSKRVTAFCHLILGLIEFFAPVLAWVAIKNQVNITPVLLGVAMCFWLTGMDISYSVQDIEFDRSWRLHSVPVALGVKRASYLVKLLHMLSLLFLIFAGMTAHTSLFFYVGVALSAILFGYQHRLIGSGQFKKAFFLCNSMITMTLFLFTALECL